MHMSQITHLDVTLRVQSSIVLAAKWMAYGLVGLVSGMMLAWKWACISIFLQKNIAWKTNVIERSPGPFFCWWEGWMLHQYAFLSYAFVRGDIIVSLLHDNLVNEKTTPPTSAFFVDFLILFTLTGSIVFLSIQQVGIATFNFLKKCLSTSWWKK